MYSNNSMDPVTKDIVNDIRNEIAEKIENESSIFGAVYAYPKATLSGFPAVIVMPSENEADYGSTNSRELTFSFHLNIFYPTNKETEYEKTELAVGEAVGELLRIFLVKHPLTKCDWAEPVPSVWGETTVGEATFRTAQVILRCVKHVTIA